MVPLPAFLVEALRAHRAQFPAELPPGMLGFPSRAGGPLRRNNFRRRVWLPSLVRAGLLGEVVEVDYEDRVRAASDGPAAFLLPPDVEDLADDEEGDQDDEV